MCIKVLRVHVRHHGYQPTQHVPFCFCRPHMLSFAHVHPFTVFCNPMVQFYTCLALEIAFALMCSSPGVDQHSSVIGPEDFCHVPLPTVSDWLSPSWISGGRILMASVGTFEVTIHQLCRILPLVF